jgi:hypothetical protein
MTTIPVTDCCAMLGIDPKTLRHWLHHAQMPLQAHPTDGRSKCLTTEQLQQLAALHARSLALPEPRVQSSPHPASATPACPADSVLLGKLVQLETQVASLQQHLTHLALDLLQERELRSGRRRQALEALLQQPAAIASSSPLSTRAEGSKRQEEAAQAPGLPPMHRRPRARVLPLIAYAASGHYVVICPSAGELSLVPDSPEWFAWLASLSSFQFVGKLGRFSAHRVFHTGPTRYWQANRVIHQHRYKPYLGGTEHLTIDCLEQVAATLQSYADSR